MFSDGLFSNCLFEIFECAAQVEQEQYGKPDQVNQSEDGEDVHARRQLVAFVVFDEAVVQPGEHGSGNEGGNHGEFEQFGHRAVEPKNQIGRAHV